MNSEGDLYTFGRARALQHALHADVTEIVVFKSKKGNDAIFPDELAKMQIRTVQSLVDDLDKAGEGVLAHGIINEAYGE